MKEFLTRFLNQIGQAFWVEIKTEVPACIYYFGPFLTEQEANEEKQGYWDDLEAEKAQGIQMIVKRCRPTELTITEDWGDTNPLTAPMQSHQDSPVRPTGEVHKV